MKWSDTAVVVDSSALVVALTDAEGATGTALRNRFAPLRAFAAPALLDYELLSALLGMVRGNKLGARELDKAMADYNRLAVCRHETINLWERVRELYSNLSAYDAHYVALAEALELPLITCDARIKRSGAAKCAIEVFD